MLKCFVQLSARYLIASADSEKAAYLNEWKCTEDVDYVECPTCKTHYKVGGRNYTRDIIPFSKRFMGENYEK